MTNEEIDALVAEKVMGIVWDGTRCRVCGWPLVQEGESGCWASNCSMRPMPADRADKPARYSTDIAAAWQVVEKMREEGFGYVMADSPGHSCIFHLADDWKGTAIEKTLPLAICKAALRAVGAEVP